MKPLKSKNLDKYLFNTISYFSFFGYPPSFDEIHTFFPVRIAKKQLKNLLEDLVRKKSLICHCEDPEYRSKRTKQSQKRSPRSSSDSEDSLAMTLDYHKGPKSLLSNFKFQLSTSPSYTLPQYATHFKNRATRQAICKKRLVLVNYYTETLAKLPFIRFVGITGSAAMGNTKRGDDVDVFIITSKGCLFIGRFFAILFSYIFNVRKGRNSVCLNLFFDERNLVIPKHKQTPYVAHEALQMKPVVSKNNMYERFLEENKWVKKFYPNVKLSIRSHSRPVSGYGVNSGGFTPVRVNPGYNFLSSPFELVLKTLQLAIIRRNKTGLIISPTQLWLFKRDFEKKIEKIL